MLTAIVLAAALAAGVTGAWSPCGFSMVETLAPSGYAGKRRTSIVACATFALGALAGALITFGGLALLGQALGAAAPAAAAAIARAAALGEARNTRIVPQVRRQVPESWRRVMPVPLAAGLYGVLLGLGFTTFILTFAVWALAGIATALGDPQTGLAIGLGFGLGRTLPLAAALFATPAHAAVTIAAYGFTDPVLDGPSLALHRPGGTGAIRGPTGVSVPGTHPAVGGGRRAWLDADRITIEALTTIPAAGADSLAVSATYVAWRTGQTISVASLDPATNFEQRAVITGAVGRPALAGNLLVFDIEGRIEAIDLTTNVRTLLRREARAQLRGPSVLGTSLAYVRATYNRQQVRIGALKPQRTTTDTPIYGTTPTASRDAGHEPNRFPAKGHINKPLWERPPPGVADTLTTTATAFDAVYVTRLRKRRGQAITAVVLKVDRVTTRR
jgi:hypothetical protein